MPVTLQLDNNYSWPFTRASTEALLSTRYAD